MRRTTTIHTTEEVEGDLRRVRQTRTDRLAFDVSEQPMGLWPDDVPIENRGDIRTIKGTQWLCQDFTLDDVRLGHGMRESRYEIDRTLVVEVNLIAIGPVATAQEIAGTTVAFVEDVREGETYRDAWCFKDRERLGTRVVAWLPGKGHSFTRRSKVILKAVDLV